MKKVFEEIALQVGGSHYPTVGGELLEKFGELVVQRCIDAIKSEDFRSVTFTTYDADMNPKLVEECLRRIRSAFSE